MLRASVHTALCAKTASRMAQPDLVRRACWLHLQRLQLGRGQLPLELKRAHALPLGLQVVLNDIDHTKDKSIDKVLSRKAIYVESA